MSSDFYDLLSFQRPIDAGDVKLFYKNKYFALDDLSSNKYYNVLIWVTFIAIITLEKDQRHYNIVKQKTFSASCLVYVTLSTC